MHIHASGIPVLTIVCVAILVAACRRRGLCGAPTPVKPSGTERRGGLIRPLLFLLVVCLLAFGLYGVRNTAQDVASRDQEPATRDNEIADAAREIKADIREWVEEFKGEVARKKTASANRQRKASRTTKAAATSTLPIPPSSPSDSDPAAEAEWSRTAFGFGGTRDDALNSAVEKVLPELLLYLRQRDTPFQVTPSVSFINKYFVTSTRFQEGDYGESAGILRVRADIRVEVTPRATDALTRSERHWHMEERMAWLAKLLAVFVLVLAAVASYVRLDEWSKGYYTGWLRLAAAGFITVFVLGLRLLAGR